MRLLSALVILFLVGCSDSGPKLDLYPLKGVVTREGKRVKGGGMIFSPINSPVKGMSVNASVREDGSFEGETLRTGADGLTTGEPGAPAGQYKVTYHPPSDGSRMGLEIELPDPITLEPKANTITIELPEKAPEGKGEIRDDLLPKSESKKD